MEGLPLPRLEAIGMTSSELEKLERLYTLAQPIEQHAMRQFFASKVEHDLTEWLEVQREVGHFVVPPSAGPITEDEQAMLDAILAWIPFSQRGAPEGVATLDDEEHLTPSQVPPSVETSRRAALANVSGSFTPNLTEGNIFPLTLTANATIEGLAGTTAGVPAQVLLVLHQPEEGNKSLSYGGAGVTWPSQPAVNLDPAAVTLLWLYTEDGGKTIYINVGPEGATGPAPFGAAEPWVSKGTYLSKAPASAVTEGGSLYLCIQSVTGSATPPAGDSVHWLCIAKRGETGPTSTTPGPTGPPGALSEVVNLGEVSGTVKIPYTEQHQSFKCLVVGNAVFAWEGFIAGKECQPTIDIKIGAGGPFTISMPGVTFLNAEGTAGLEPAWYTAAGAHNWVTVVSQDGGLTIFGRRDEEGKEGKGKEGTPGTNGTNGAGSSAYTNLILPYHSGNLKVTGSVAFGAAFTAFFVLWVVEQAEEIKEILVPNRATIAGELRVAVFDCGASVAEHFEVLAESASVAQTGASSWQAMPLASALKVTAGEILMAAVMGSATNATVGVGTTPSATPLTEIPTGLLKGYPSAMGKARLMGIHTFSEMKFKALAKAELEATTNGVILGGVQ